MSDYEAVLGLEVHVQLRTRSKIFCACPVDAHGAPNAHTCPVCLGHPGVLPVLNREVVRLALRFGAAVGATVTRPARFARKNYFYPDLPKGYQITQFEEPILAGGEIPFRVGAHPRVVRLERAHLEEDAGKSFHPEGSRERATLVDLNRAGTPLLEIVTLPVLRDPAEASACLHRIHALVTELGVSDGSMEDGSLRADANVSVRRRGEDVLHPKTEVKNLNSFRHVERALRWEVERQTRLHEEGEIPASATRLWDEGEGRTRVLRSKEEAEDYRYFPEPDLPPLEVPEAWIAEAREHLPELPWEREARFAAAYALGDEEARLLASDPALAGYTERAIAAAGDARAAANWILTEILRLRKETPGGLAAVRVTPEALGRLLVLAGDGTLSTPLAKAVFSVLAEEGGDPDTVVRERNLLPVDDDAAVAEAARAAVAAHPGPFAQWRKGKGTVRGFFVGQVMRTLGGRARPDAVGRAVDAALAARRDEEETT